MDIESLRTEAEKIWEWINVEKIIKWYSGIIENKISLILQKGILEMDESELLNYIEFMTKVKLNLED